MAMVHRIKAGEVIVEEAVVDIGVMQAVVDIGVMLQKGEISGQVIPVPGEVILTPEEVATTSDETRLDREVIAQRRF
jgi:hypothetical protein